MKPTEYLDAVKARLNVSSDYALAKRLELANGSLSGIRSGHRHIPLDVAFRIAITLEMDPAEVVADLEAQREKNEQRRGFWRSFASRARSSAVAVLCTLALIASATCGSVPGMAGGADRLRLRRGDSA